MKTKTLRLSGTNCFLVKNGERYVLIDTGYEEDWELFQKQLGKSGVGLNELSHIILTHHHDDHCGLLNKITRENEAIQVVVSSHANDLLVKGENDQTHGGGMINHWVRRLWILKQLFLSVRLMKWVDKKNNLKFPPYLVRGNDLLVSGETRLRDVGIKLDGTIFETPGHSLDSISILFDDGDCFVGDAAANFLQFAGTHYCVIFVTDLAEYYRSWESIISRGAGKILPAHGEPFSVDKLKQNLGRNKKENMVLI
jgi:hydroxyacylglutathione hydrolase